MTAPLPLPSASAAHLAAAAPVVPALTPWLTEVVHAVVSFAAVVVGGVITIYVTQATFKRQARQAERTEAERHRKESVRERLLLQREVYADYIRLVTKHQAESAPVLEGVVAKVERRKREHHEAHQDALAFYGKAVIAFGSKDFAIQAADTIKGVAEVRNDPMLELLVTGILANVVTEQMLRSIAATEAALDLAPIALVPEPIVPMNDYAKERNRGSVRSVVDRAGYSHEKLEAIFAAIDKKANKPSVDGEGSGEESPASEK